MGTADDPSAPGAVQATIEAALDSAARSMGDPADREQDRLELDRIAAGLDAAADRAVDLLAGHLDDFAYEAAVPMRLPKARVVALGGCERHAVAEARASQSDDGLSPAGLEGRALDVFVQHEIVEGPVADPLEDLLSWLAASGEPDVRDQLIACADELSLAELAAAARAWAGIDPRWWPRTQGSASVHLADAAVRCEGRTDVELGGPLTGRPGVVVEVKRGRPHAAHLAEVTHYALLVALRDGAVPALVARWYPGGALATMPISIAVLESAALRLGDAIGAWAEIASGRPPSEMPGPPCGWCPDAAVCPSFQASPDPFDPSGVDP